MTNNEPILMILAAGIGSRYGGLKQIDPVGPSGEILMEYAIYDAVKAGFKRVLFIIGDNKELFEGAIGSRVREHIEVMYARQRLDDIPEGVIIPAERVKPWGTSHAVLAARDIVDAPFAVINADDYYGPKAFQLVYDYLSNDAKPGEALMVNYVLGNTLSKNGHVTRGICNIDDSGYLVSIKEHFKIRDGGDKALFTEDEGETWQELSKNSAASMNFWGFHPSLMDELKQGFKPLLEKELANNPLKLEYLLPASVDDLIQAGKYKVVCKQSADQWHGVTYKEDRPVLVSALKELINDGTYPEKLWE